MSKKVINIKSKSKARGSTNPLDRRLHTIPEAAYYMGRGIYSMRTLIWNGELPIIRQGEGGKIWIDREDMDLWILRNKFEYQPLPPSKKKNKSK